MTLDRSLTTMKPHRTPESVVKYLASVERQINALIRIPAGVTDFNYILQDLNKKGATYRETAVFWCLRDTLVDVTTHGGRQVGPRQAASNCADYTAEMERHYTLLHYAVMHYFAHGLHTLICDKWLNDYRLKELIQRDKAADQLHDLNLVQYLERQTVPIRMSPEAINSLQSLIDLRHSSQQPAKRWSWRRRKSP